MKTVSFFIIQIESHVDTVGILNIRYAAGSCLAAFERLVTTGTPATHDYLIVLLFVPDGRFLHRCEEINKKYIKDKQELMTSFSDIFYAG